MSKLDELLTEQFYRWELEGRGWRVFENSVGLEPPFRPFSGYVLPRSAVPDDGRKHTRSSGFLERLRQSLAPPPAPEPDADTDFVAVPEMREPQELVELQLSLPFSRSVAPPQVEPFLRQVSRSGEPLVLEILGTERETVPQFVASPQAATRVRNAVEAFFPGVICAPVGGTDATSEALSLAWDNSEARFAVVEFGLGREMMLPLGKPRCDLLASIVAAMDVLGKGELGLLQIIFEPVQESWAESMVRAVIGFDGRPVFSDRPDLVRGVEQKIASPLFAVVVRLVSCAADIDRAWELIANLAAPLSAFARLDGNHLLPLHNEDYAAHQHELDILTRLSRRSGMVLSMEELIPLIMPPVTTASRRLRRESKKTNAAPELVQRAGVLCLGMNTHAGVSTEIFLSPENRVRHMHIIGASGRGKSTFLLNLIRQDIENGEGVAVFDPHGDLVDAVLGFIPPERVDNVVVLDPSDEQFAVGLNILAAHSDFERSLLASDLVGVFRRLSTSWGDQMESVLRNAILAFLESSRGGTLSDLRRFLLDAGFRKDFLRTVTDPEIVFYWQRAFPQLTGGKSIGPVLTRLDEFLSRKPIRYMVSQDTNRIDFSEIIDRGRILLVKLPQGLIGRENTALLGSLITAKLQMAAMSRQRLAATERRDFWCYMDEFQHFITPSMAEILTGARKYRLGMILAHQDLHQLDADRDVANAVLSNSYTRVVFTVGDADARTFEQGFTHFEARDLMNLPIGEAVCRVERSDFDFNLAIPNLDSIDEITAAQTRDEVIAASRIRYARPRAEVEAELLRKSQTPETPPAAAEPETTAPTPVAEPLALSESLTPRWPVASESPPTPTPTQPSVSESDPVASAPSDPPKPAPELGRGGMIHRDAQLRIKSVAEELGFRATIESPVGSGGADLVLERNALRIAVEISVTTGAGHELANVVKCLTGDYVHVAFVCADLRKAGQVAERLRERVSESDASRVGYYQVETLVEYLRALPNPFAEEAITPMPKPSTPSKKRFKGWTVKTKATDQTNEENREKEEQAIRALAEALRKPQRND